MEIKHLLGRWGGYLWLFSLLMSVILIFDSCQKNYPCASPCIVPPQPGPIFKDKLPIVTRSSHPCANAGAEQIVFLPEKSAQLNGSNSYDSNGNVATYNWSQISGPGQSLILNPTKAITFVQNLSQGIYQFELKVTDASGLYATDTVPVIVTNIPAADCSTNRPLLTVHLVPYSTLSQNKEYVSSAQAGCPCKILFAGGFDNNPNSTTANAGVDIFGLANHSRSSYMLSQPRQGMAVATVGNKVLFAGGGNHDIGWVTTRVDIYDATTGEWTTAELSEARSYMAAATLGNKVFFAGGGNWGINGNSFYNGSSVVDIYDNSTNTWSKASLSVGRYELSATVSGSQIYFAGGLTAPVFGQGHVERTIDIFDGSNNTWSVSELYEPKADMASIAVGNKIFWAGGLSDLNSPNTSNLVEIRDVNTGVSVLSCLHVGKYRLDAALKGNAIVFLNGITHQTFSTDYLDQIDLYDLTTGKWSVGQLDHPLTAAGVISAKNALYIAGGTSTGFDYFNQVWTLEW
jgi:N-acetylneuraminic acid mutarotase